MKKTLLMLAALIAFFALGAFVGLVVGYQQNDTEYFTLSRQYSDLNGRFLDLERRYESRGDSIRILKLMTQYPKGTGLKL